MRITRPIRTLLVLTVVAGVAAGCGGSTQETPAPGGGAIVDSAPPDAEPEAAIEAGPDAEPDVAQQDAPIDQSVEDTSAVDADFQEGSLFDLTMPDVALNDSGATAQTCYDCAAAQCSSDMAKCDQDVQCHTLVLCLFTQGCIDGSGMGGLNLQCAQGCLTASGIGFDLNNPAVQIALKVASCVNSSCQAECALPDGGVIPPMDGGP